MYLSELSIRRPVLMTVIIVILLLLGAVAIFKLPIDLFPQIEFPVITVMTTYLGAGPREVETLLSKPLEEELSTVDGLKHIRSISQEGLSVIMLEFELDKKVDAAAADVRDKVSLVEPSLPDDAERPLISKFDINAEPVLRMAVTGERSPQSLYTLTDTAIKPQFARVNGVASAEIVGGQEREILIALDQRRLNAYRLSPEALAQAITAANLELPSGHITQELTEYTVRLAGKVPAVEEIAEVRIAAPDGEQVRIKDLGTVVDTVKEVRELARFQGKPSLGLIIRKRPDANTIAVAAQVKGLIASLKDRLPPDIRIEIAEDRSEFIRGSLSEVRDNIVIGIILTALCLFLFLHDLRSTLIITVAMPTSIVSTFLLLYLSGYSINIMSMLGLALSVGVLVNNAILVLENTHRYLDLGKNRREAARMGAGEIAAAVASTTLTNIVVFVPIAFMSSIIGQFFRQFAMTVVFSTIFSLFVSFTLTPMMAALFLKEKTGESARGFFAHWDRFYETLSRNYGRLVRKLIRRKWLTIAVSVLVFIVSMKVLPPLVGFEFFPKSDEGAFKVTIETPVGTSLAVTDAVARRVEAIVETLPEKEKVFTTVGKLSRFLGGSDRGVNLAEVDVNLVELARRRRSTLEVLESIRPALASIPGAAFTLQEVERGGGGSDKPIQLEIRGDEIAVLNDLAEEAIALARSIPGAVDVDKDWRVGKPEIWIIPDRGRADRYGISVGQIASVLRSSLTGEVASTYREADDEFDIRLRLQDGDRAFREQIDGIRLLARNGESVPLSAVARIEMKKGPTTITRIDRERAVTVSANLSGISSGELYQNLKNLLDAKTALPPGYTYFFSGEIEQIKENFGDIFVAFGLAVALTLLLLAGILESWRYALMIMLSLPLAMVTVFLTLIITGTTNNIFSLMAVVMLVGMVINNTIVIVDYSNLLRQEGMELVEAVVTACTVRLRPIIMANFTDIVAMIPLALGIGWGGGFRAPMAIVSIGGLLGGYVLSLIVMPPLYVVFSSPRQFLKEIQAKAASLLPGSDDSR